MVYPSHPSRFSRWSNPTGAEDTRQIVLPHPGHDLRDPYNQNLHTLIMAIGVESRDGADPRHCFWRQDETIDSFRRGVDKEGIRRWLSDTFDFTKEDRGVGFETPLLDLVLGFEALLDAIERAPGHRRKKATIRFEVHLSGPLDAVEHIERQVDNAALWAFISALKTETVSLGGAMVLTHRGGRPYIGVRTEGEILSFFEIPFLPTGPNGEELDLPYEPEQERHL